VVEEELDFRRIKDLESLTQTPRPMYKLEYLRGESIVGHYYAEELMPVNRTWRTGYRIDKILDARIRRGIREQPFRGDDRSRFRQLDQYVQIQETEAMVLLCHSYERRSRGVYPDNTVSDFKIRLVKHVDLATDAWEVGLFEFLYTSPASGTELHPIFLYWDLIGPQLVGDMFRRCLRIVYVSQGPSCVLQRVLPTG